MAESKHPSALTLPQGSATASREGNKHPPLPPKQHPHEERQRLHLALDVVLEQFLVHAVELGAADVVEVVSDVARVLLGAGAVRALKFPVPILVVEVRCKTATREAPLSAQGPGPASCYVGPGSCTNSSLGTIPGSL